MIDRIDIIGLGAVGAMYADFSLPDGVLHDRMDEAETAEERGSLCAVRIRRNSDERIPGRRKEPA